ncbi:PucR family transcriptional regulator [Amphibacillus jilinensis]|uniref:PucR family transcriptional regulator n=1 Tax=Amphibacillus jilinensis TaxID=1216008 RepID=UPI0002DCF1BA|nr:helix-turn-helix domain-containing protein [Amphibacillus jilinensis]
MINQLKQLYPSLTMINDQESVDFSKYKWFTTPSNDVIGIAKTELDNRDLTLLSLMLTPYYGAHPPITTREKQWYQLLFEPFAETSFNLLSKDYRFVYFSLSELLTDPTDFRAAIDGLYPTTPPLIWIDQQSGIIIEEERFLDEDSLSYYEMAEIFTSDFLIDVHFYIGPYMTSPADARAYYAWMKDSFNRMKAFNVRSVMSYVSAVPYLLPTLSTDHDYHFLVKAILKETATDEELLRSIQTFLECNSNTSLAAKEMYMHRNSLQYRIDKFIEKTEIDVKQFEGAISVYLILLIKRYLD